ncbi:MAG: mannose-1-phosphate guanylyltransferase/mannose-6-phosphate isomerase [Chlamydiia bacterium]|nr:mannose-1-phosphate guanylyltransferase/mannose-6-phosphate isomerase [Chlamydiia bacterium]
MERKIVPVILAGGSGTRLWPLSRKSSPKQFLKLIGDLSLLQQTLLRVTSLPSIDQIFIVINQDHYFLCQDQVKELELQGVTMILEPCSRNTAPAIALAAHHLMQSGCDQSTLLILPADHLIGESSEFTTLIESASALCKEDRLITFGVVPNSPKTGYGYIERGKPLEENCFEVKKFTEKPDEQTAIQFLESKNYFWNSGMFLFHSKTYLQELKKGAPEIYDGSLEAYQKSEAQGDYLRIDPKTFEKCPSDSIDYAVMEKTDKATVVPFHLPWSDLGCWASVADAADSDENDNVIKGNVIHKECSSCFLSSDNKQLVATIGVKDLIVVSTADAVLVADKTYSQEVKEIVNGLKKTNHHLTIDHKRVHRPWGTYEEIIKTDTFQIRYLIVESKQKLTLDKSAFLTVIHGKIQVKTEKKSLFLSKKTAHPIPPQTTIINDNVQAAHLLEINLLDEKLDLKSTHDTIETLLSRK